MSQHKTYRKITSGCTEITQYKMSVELFNKITGNQCKKFGRNNAFNELK